MESFNNRTSREWKTKFKVTRRIPYLPVSKTKIFESKEKAKEQFEEWLE